jgi:hypothetical protein
MSYKNDFLPFLLGEVQEISTSSPELGEISGPDQKVVMTSLKYPEFNTFYDAWLSAA